MFCCEECFNNEEIKQYININGNKGNCDFCNAKNVTVISCEMIGNFIRQGIKRAYDNIEDGTGAMWDSDIHEYIAADGSSAGKSILDIMEEEEVFSEELDCNKVESLLETIIEESGPSCHDIKNGEQDDLSDIYSEFLVIKDSLFGIENLEEYHCWNVFKYMCKYYNRYFDMDKKHSEYSREYILSKLNTVFENMKVVIKKGNIFYRVRKYTIEENKLDKINYNNEIAPDPPEFSSNNRMSPAGISYTYLADNENTCIVETRLNKDDTYLLGEFMTIKDLDILDLSKVPCINVKSIFNKDYDNCCLWIGDFIEMFKNEISKPISNKDKDLEYVPTQILAEYIRKLGYDGIKFESSVRPKTFNIVLFYGNNTEDITDNFYYKKFKLIDFKSCIELKKLEYKQLNAYKKIVKYRKDLIKSIDIRNEIRKYDNTSEDIEESINESLDSIPTVEF